MSRAARVLVADDHAPTRAGVRRVLEEHGFTVCAEVSTAEAAVRAALEERPDICLLDIRMPGSGIAAAAAVSEQLPATRIVMLTVSRDDDDLFDALRAGASGYLLKDLKRADLPNALRAVLSGEAALPPSLIAKLVDELRERGKRRKVFLSRRPAVELGRREWEVLELLREGASTAAIARRLFITEATVRSHVSRLLAKLDVPDRRAAVRLLEPER